MTGRWTMKIETAFFHKIFSKLGLESLFLWIWRKKTTRNVINAPRRIIYFLFRKRYEVLGSNSEEISRITESLVNSGFAQTHISRFKDMPTLQSLQDEYDQLLALEIRSPHSRKSKEFIQRLVDDDYDFVSNSNSSFCKFVTNRDLFYVATRYLRLVPKRTSFKVWRSHFTGSEARSASQNWHRDYNEFQMIRVFLYLNHVTVETGAGQYISGTHYLGDSYNLLEYSEESGTYATDDEIAENFTLDRVLTAEGEPGTIVLIDTAGLHRGGFHTIPSERRIALLTFSTAADIMPTKIKV